MRRTLGTMATAGALVLGVAGTAQAAIVTQPVRSFNAVEGDRVSVDERLVMFSDTVQDCAGSQFSITVNWGDGTSSNGVIDFDSGDVGIGCDYGVSGRHTYSRAGTYTVTATVCRAGVCATAPGGTARVANAPVRGEGKAFGAIAGQQAGGELAEFNDDNRSAQPGDYTAVVDWGDGSTSTGVLGGKDGRFDVSGQHTYASPGQYLQRVTLLEGGVPVAVSSPGTVSVAAPAAPVAVSQSAASRSITGARPALRMRVGSIRRRSLHKGLPIQASLPSSTRSLRVAVVRIGGSRAQTLATVPVQVRGGLVVGGVRQVALRVKLSKALRKRMKAGRYALQFRVGDSGTVSTLFTVR